MKIGMPRFPVGASDIVDGSITNAKISASAAIAKSKLAALGIVDADVAAGAAIAKSKLAALGIVDADVAVGAAIDPTKISGTAVVNSHLSVNASTNVHGVKRAVAATNSAGNVAAFSGNGGWSFDATGTVGQFKLTNNDAQSNTLYAVKYQNGVRTAFTLAASAIHTFTALAQGDDLKVTFVVNGVCAVIEVSRYSDATFGFCTVIILSNREV